MILRWATQGIMALLLWLCGRENLVIFYKMYLDFYTPKGTSGGILKSNRPSVCQSIPPLQIVSQRYLINYWSKFDETSQKDKA